MQISLVGVGLMGAAMTERLLTLGHDVVVYNRTKAKCEALQQRGAVLARSAVEAIQSSSCTILMLSDATAIHDAVFAAGKPDFQNRTVIQMGTIAPSESLALGRAIRSGLGDYFEAPVLGSIAEARTGRLVVMVGGQAEHVARWNEVLTCFCHESVLVGPIGQAAALKLALNQLLAAQMTAFSVSLGLILHSGIAVETFMNVLRHSSLMASMFERKLPRMLDHDYANPRFSTGNLLKDVQLSLDAAREAKVATPSLDGIRDVFEHAVARDLGDLDYAAVFEAVAPQAGDHP